MTNLTQFICLLYIMYTVRYINNAPLAHNATSSDDTKLPSPLTSASTLLPQNKADCARPTLASTARYCKARPIRYTGHNITNLTQFICLLYIMHTVQYCTEQSTHTTRRQSDDTTTVSPFTSASAHSHKTRQTGCVRNS